MCACRFQSLRNHSPTMVWRPSILRQFSPTSNFTENKTKTQSWGDLLKVNNCRAWTAPSEGIAGQHSHGVSTSDSIPDLLLLYRTGPRWQSWGDHCPLPGPGPRGVVSLNTGWGTGGSLTFPKTVALKVEKEVQEVVYLHIKKVAKKLFISGGLVKRDVSWSKVNGTK